MSKYDFTALDVTRDKVRKYPLYQLAIGDKTPVLHVHPATDATPGFFNAMLKRAHKNQRVVAAAGANYAILSESRAEDRGLYAEHIVCGWDSVTDSTGKPVPFSPAEASDFIAALPDWVFDELRLFCSTAANFADGIDAKVTAGN